MSGESEAIHLPPENVFGHRKKLEFIRRNIREHVDKNPGRELRLLDVGCSNGQHVTFHVGDLGVGILAIDPHEASILYAREHNTYPATIRFENCTIENVAVDEKFDIILMADIIEHVDDPGTLLDEALKRLRAGGIVIASIPNGYGPFEIENALDKRGCLLPSYWLFTVLSKVKGMLTGRRSVDGEQAGIEDRPYAYECGHVQFFTMGAFGKMVDGHGLEIGEWRKGPWVGALCTSTWWGRLQGFCSWNARMGDYLPSWMVSTWYFQLHRKN